jgi:hypothetical protein
MSNDKAGPREDDQRKHEESGLLRDAAVDNRTEAHLFQDTQDLEPGRQPLTAGRAGNAPSIDEMNAKSDFARWFRPSELPTNVARLLQTAGDEGAPDEVLDALRRLEPERRFDTIGAVWDAVTSQPARGA